MKTLQGEGRKVPFLESEPNIGLYELHIIKAIKSCSTYSDVKIYAELLNVPDELEFVEMVTEMKGEINA